MRIGSRGWIETAIGRHGNLYPTQLWPVQSVELECQGVAYRVGLRPATSVNVGDGLMALRPPEEHQFMRLHALVCDSERELFRWDGSVWRDRNGTHWCPQSLEEMGWSYGAPYRHCGPTPPFATIHHHPLSGVKRKKARTDLDWGKLYSAAMSIVPKSFNKADREDIAQEIALEIMETDRSIDDLWAIRDAVIGRHAKTYDAWKPHARTLDLQEVDDKQQPC
jgi:hypothetical protein